MTTPKMPTYSDLLWPTLVVLKNNGGSASIQEFNEKIPRLLALPDEIADKLHLEGPQTEVTYRLGWALTNLKWIGAVNNTDRGVWSITPKGRAMPSDEKLQDAVRQERKRRQRGPAKPLLDDEPKNVEWKTELLGILRELTPETFERLCQLILRESDFTSVEVTGGSGDGGIDGTGVLRVNLISFHVRFQCKRYTGSVQAREIRDFRGAMVGRADKGLFLTTGQFTRGAVREAKRDGAPAIDLFDGLDLCELLRKLKLGVSTEKVIRPQPEFFAEI